MNNQQIMVGRIDLRVSEQAPIAGAANAIVSSSLNLLVLALITDIPGVQT